MKRQNLRAKLQDAGLEAEKIDEIVNYIMDENGKDINQAKANVDDDFAKVKAENEALKQSNTELTAKVDSYKDYEDLKKYKADAEALKEETKITEYLKSIGCKHPDLIKSQIDFSKASYDEEKKTFTGLDETVKGLKEKYKDMFEVKKVEDKFNPNLDGGNSGNESEFMKRYKAENPSLKF